uniref:Uncharacterized protein n=1 Tax=Oryza glumipatula TaxID=40148 RepID=A0A0E0BT34_9ORYZ
MRRRGRRRRLPSSPPSQIWPEEGGGRPAGATAATMRAGRPAAAPLTPSLPELSHSWGTQFSNLPPFASSSPPFIPACCLLLQVENVSFIANKLETIWKGIASGEYTNFSLKTTLFLVSQRFKQTAANKLKCSLAEDVGVTSHASWKLALLNTSTRWRMYAIVAGWMSSLALAAATIAGEAVEIEQAEKDTYTLPPARNQAGGADEKRRPAMN